MPPTEDLVDDPDLLARWLVIAGLIDMAAHMLERRSGAWAAMAITAADAASEAMLGLVATGAAKPPGEKAPFDELLKVAETRLRIDPRLRARLLAGHRARNLALHTGNEPRPAAVERVIRAARDLRQTVALSTTVLGELGTVGPVRAVGQLVGNPDIREALTAADEALRAERYVDAVDQAAIAFSIAMRRLEPRLHPDGPVPNMRVWGETDNRPEKVVAWVDGRLQQHETWILAGAVGMHPVELQRLRLVLGEPLFTLAPGPPTVYRNPKLELTPRMCEAAVLAAVDAIFRMWQSEAIRGPQPWELDVPTAAKTQ